MADKGQTALSYLLIVVVAIVVVVVVMTWMQESTVTTENSATCVVDGVFCRSNTCQNAGQCPLGCGDPSTVRCEGGYCVPGTCDSSSAVPGGTSPSGCTTCAGDLWGTYACNTLPVAITYSGGDLDCTPDCIEYDESGCYYERTGAMQYAKKSYLDADVGCPGVAPGCTPPNCCYITSGDAIGASASGPSFNEFCSPLTDCSGRRLDLINTPMDGTYTITDWLYFVPTSSIVHRAILDRDFAPSDTGSDFTWTYRLYGPEP